MFWVFITETESVSFSVRAESVTVIQFNFMLCSARSVAECLFTTPSNTTRSTFFKVTSFGLHPGHNEIVVLCCAVFCVVLCCIAFCCAVLHCVAVCCTVLCCAELCCVVLHCVVLRLLCCIVLCCAVLCCVQPCSMCVCIKVMCSELHIVYCHVTVNCRSAE